MNRNRNKSEEESLFPPRLENQKDLEMDKPHFVETLRTLEDLIGLFACCNCGAIPEGKVFVLGLCHHKYCENCGKKMAGKPCIMCREQGYPKDVKHDYFSGSVLFEIPKIYHMIKRWQETDCNGRNQEGFHGLSQPPRLITQTQTRRNERVEGKEKGLENATDKKEQEENKNDIEVACDKKNGKKKSIENDRDNKKKNQKGIETDSGKKEGKDFGIENDNDKKKGKENDGDNNNAKKEEKDQSIENVGGKKKDLGEAVTAKKVPVSNGKRNEVKKTKSLKEDPNPIPASAPALIKPPIPKPDLEVFEFTDFTPSAQLVSNQNPCPSPSPSPDVMEVTPQHKRASLFNEKMGKLSEQAKKTIRNLSLIRVSTEKKIVTDSPPKPKLSSKKGNDSSKTSNESKPTEEVSKVPDNKKIPVKKRKREEEEGANEAIIPEAKVKPLLPKSDLDSKTKVTSRRRMSVGSVEMETKKSLSPKSTSTTEVTSKRGRKRRASSAGSSESKVSALRATVPPTSPSIVSLNDSISSSKGGKQKRNAKGETGLHIACRTGHVEKVKHLIEAGCEVDATDNAGWTALHEVVNSKKTTDIVKTSLIEILQKNGCNINAVGGPEQETALHSAVISGSEKVVETLLDLGASPNIRDNSGQLPRDCAFNDLIIKMLDEKAGRSSRVAGGNTSSNDSVHDPSTLNNYDTALTSVEDDPAVLQVMITKAVLYFNYEVSPDVIDSTRNVLKMKVVDKLSASVSHIVHKLGKNEEGGDGRKVLRSMNYLFGLAHGMWHVSSRWIEQSLKKCECLSPTQFEITGSCGDNSECNSIPVPVKCRANHEKGNPGLLHGFSFYLYKTCGYTDKNLNLSKRDLINLISAAGGNISNREPDPKAIDPLENLYRFHTQSQANNSDFSSSTNSNSKFVMTSHIILYEDKAPPPENKRYKLEHLKTLRSDWLVDSILHFILQDPARYC